MVCVCCVMEVALLSVMCRLETTGVALTGHRTKTVAVKQFIVRAGTSNVGGASSNSGLEVMLRLESSLLASLSHPHIVQYYGLHYSKRRSEYNMIIEYVDGGTLADKLKAFPGGLPAVC